MKVIHLTGKDFYGAGRAAYRLHKGLLDAGVESEMWVGQKRSNDDSVVELHGSMLRRKILWLFRNLEKISIKLKSNKPIEMFSSGGWSFSLLDKINKANPDIVHVHWINRGFMHLNNLAKIKMPLVISMHDMWYFTGGCHYDAECNRFKQQCGKCPVLSSAKQNDLSVSLLKMKHKVYQQKSDIYFVGLSKWMANCASSSYLLKNRNIINLPNGIDTDVYRFIDNGILKERLQIDLQKQVILYAAVDALSESRKGYANLQKALSSIDAKKYEVLVIGEASVQKEIAGIKTHFLGEINNDQQLIESLSLADVTVVPSLQENLSNMIMESLACETPVVAFNIGGNGDMLKHKANGYLARQNDVEDLALGINWCCSMQQNATLANNARATVLESFEIKKVTDKYLSFYQSIINVDEQ